MITVVCWRWTPPEGARSHFPASAVTTLRNMVARHYTQPHRFVCVTDRPEDIDGSIETVPDWGDYKELPPPSGNGNPSCYRRLRAFSPDVADVFGPRFVSLDLDVVLTGDVTPLWDRREDFVIYGDTNPKTFYNGSMFLMSAGARRQIWERFDPQTSIKQAFAAGHHGSDQAWLSFCLGPGEAKWRKGDGVYSFRNDLGFRRPLPGDARLVVFHGRVKPWQEYAQLQCPWIKELYH